MATLVEVIKPKALPKHRETPKWLEREGFSRKTAVALWLGAAIYFAVGEWWFMTRSVAVSVHMLGHFGDFTYAGLIATVVSIFVRIRL